MGKDYLGASSNAQVRKREQISALRQVIMQRKNLTELIDDTETGTMERAGMPVRKGKETPKAHITFSSLKYQVDKGAKQNPQHEVHCLE